MAKSDQLYKGKYFMVKSQLSELVLEVKGAVDRPGTAAVLGVPLRVDQGNDDHQLWYRHHETNTLRSKLNGLCLSVKDDKGVLMPWKAGRGSQQWVYSDHQFQQQEDFEVVIGVADESLDVGARVVIEDNSGSVSQMWTVTYREAQYFILRSQLDETRVLDVEKADRSPQTEVLLYTDQGKLANNQLWYEDPLGVIRSKLNGFALDTKARPGRVVMMPVRKGVKEQHWMIAGESIRNRYNPKEAITLYSKTKTLRKNDEWLTVESYKSSPNQLWFVEYIPEQRMAISHSGNGQSVMVRNKLSGLVLEVKGASHLPGVAIVTGYGKKGSKAQHFHKDESTGTIRSDLNDLCFSMHNDRLVLMPFDPYNRTQQWRLTGVRIQNRYTLKQVLEVKDASMEADACVQMADDDAQAHQQWELQHVPARSFRLINHLSSRALDVQREKEEAGANVIVWEPHKELKTNQLWYEDERGLLRSKLNGFVPHSTGDHAEMRPYDPLYEKCHWVIKGDFVANLHDEDLVLDIMGKTKKNGATVHAWKKHGGPNQMWMQEYVDLASKNT